MLVNQAKQASIKDVTQNCWEVESDLIERAQAESDRVARARAESVKAMVARAGQHLLRSGLALWREWLVQQQAQLREFLRARRQRLHATDRPWHKHRDNVSMFLEQGSVPAGVNWSA